ncbi:alpha/beta hydrolase [Corynebacterium simulans]|uniref:alpha/beta fold hydrolase n=1 Tax=Corynebacterium TaxID=1716 RepID=UPI0008A3D226|nr:MULTISPECIES: alpha/beta hydrolase [Corynebacterium]MCG7248485.1 alpha/beta hydrolase [Corynebacterium simulans]MDK7139966.1 alpha/beta hydrolase [Corynebacterium simulans]OFQ42089.1 alpha/beta hydrolase [Corynebacterium sp. HMSC076D02]
MVHRARAKTIARSWARRLRPTRRNEQHLMYESLHNHTDEPGLTGIDSLGTVRNDGLDIAWYEVGPQDSDITVVFIHGYCLSAEAYYSQVDYMRRHFPEIRCLLVDIRGHGLSTEVTPAQCTVDAAADDVLAVLSKRASRGKLVVVGHSLGGMVALNVIRRAPDEVYQRVDSALLIATSMRRFAAKGVAQILESKALGSLYNACMRLPGRMDRIRFEVAQWVAPLFAALLAGFPQMEKLQFHVAMLMDTPLSSYTGFFDDLLDHSEYAATDRLARLRGEVIVGSADIVTPRSQSDVILDHWPAARLTEVDGAGHMVILEEPEAISEALGRLLVPLVD